MGSPSRISEGLRAWQAEWSSYQELSERQVAAVRSSMIAAAALLDYSRAFRLNLNSHADGVTAVSILKLLDHLWVSTGMQPESADVDDIFDLIPAVRIGARAAGAHATLAELCLVSGDQTSPGDRREALDHYAEVSAADREALLERLRLFASLGFRPALVSEAIKVLGN